jgi:hypothetical protein
VGFWHTGYAEFHESAGLGDFVYTPTPPPPIRYECEYCEKVFGELEALRRHRFESHPVRQPTLLLRGRPIGGKPARIQTRLKPEDISIEDATKAWINGDSLSTSAIANRLSDFETDYVTIRLENDSVRSEVHLDFRISNEADLKGVERALVHLARKKQLTVDAIGNFNAECRQFHSAMSYCNGIAHYLYGVMAKERSADTGLRREEYATRYVQALEDLSGLERPMSRTIQAIVAFHFNHFSDAQTLAPDGALKDTACAFSDLLNGLPWHYEKAFEPTVNSAVENLFTDQVTLEILRDASKGLAELKSMTPKLIASLNGLPAGFDRTKRVMLAAEALAARNQAESRIEAHRLLRVIASQESLYAWRASLNERLNTNA